MDYELNYLFGLNEREQEEIKAIAEVIGDDLKQIVNIHEKGNFTFYRDMDMVAVAEEIIHDCYNVPKGLENYIDYEAFANALEYDNYTEVENGVIHIE